MALVVLVWPAGRPAGVEVLRQPPGCGLLDFRREVDSARIAITAAIGRWKSNALRRCDRRTTAAVVPVCGIGTYDPTSQQPAVSVRSISCQRHVRHDRRFAGHGRPARPLFLVISATRDAFQFSVGEAAKSVAFARGRFRTMGLDARIRHIAIESGHDYNQSMREAMYGWLDRWLRRKGDGEPIPEPKITLEDVESLRCYPIEVPPPTRVWIVTQSGIRPAGGAGTMVALPAVPDHQERWRANAERMRATLRDQILGGFPARIPSRRPERSSAIPKSCPLRPSRVGCRRRYAVPRRRGESPSYCLLDRPPMDRPIAVGPRRFGNIRA